MVRRWGTDVLRLRLEVLRLPPIARRGPVVLLVAAGLAGGILPILFTVSIGRLVGQIPEVVGAGLGSAAGDRLVFTLALTTVVFAAMQVLAPIQQTLQIVAQRRIDEALRAGTLRDLTRPHGIAHLEDPGLRDHLSLIRQGSLDFGASPGTGAVSTLPLIGRYLQGLGGAAIVGLAFSWWAAAALVAVCFLCRRIGPAIAKESRVFGLTDWLIARFGLEWRAGMEASEDIQRRLFRNYALAHTALLVAYGAVFLGAVNGASDGSLGLEASSRPGPTTSSAARPASTGSSTSSSRARTAERRERVRRVRTRRARGWSRAADIVPSLGPKVGDGWSGDR